jgi:DNA polymerase-3 subunit gamma/tau
LAAFLGEILGKEGISADAEALTLIAREAAGSARDALSLCDQAVAFCGATEKLTRDKVVAALGVADRRALFELCDAILARDAEGALRALDAAHMTGQDLGQFARALLGHLRDLAVVTSIQDPSGLIDAPETELEALRVQAKRTDARMAAALFDRFTHAAGEILESQFPKMHFELALLDLVRAEPLVPLGDLLERLAELEKAAPEAPSPRQKAPGKAVPAPPPSTASPQLPAPPPSTASPQLLAPPPSAASPQLNAPAWEAFLQSVEEKSPAAFAVLALGKPVAFKSAGVILAFAPGELGLAEMRKTEIEEHVATAFGAKVPVSLRALDTVGAPAGPSLDESNRRRADEERDRRRSEARAHPSTKATLDVFGGAEIKDIKVDFD